MGLDLTYLGKLVRTAMQPDTELPTGHCGRTVLHNPHEYLDDHDATNNCPGTWNIPPPGHLLSAPGTWNIPPPSHPVLRTDDPDPDGHLDTVLQPPKQSNPAMLELIQWWTTNASQAIDQIAGKIDEYGGQHTAALDLIDVGRDLARIAGREVTDEEATELGIYFYARGKFSRWTAAVAEGRRPSDDTLFDAMVYLTMAIRNRAAGGWPWPHQPGRTRDAGGGEDR